MQGEVIWVMKDQCSAVLRSKCHQWLATVQLRATKQGNGKWWTRLTSPQQFLRHIISPLRPTHEPNGNRNTLPRQPTIVVFVGDIPYFTKGCGREIGASKGLDGNVAGKDAEFLRVKQSKYLVDEGCFRLRWREACGGHGGRRERRITSVCIGSWCRYFTFTRLSGWLPAALPQKKI